MGNEHAVKFWLGTVPGALFKLGQLVATPGAWEALNKTMESPMDFVKRHVTGDWGDLDEHDHKCNVEALEHGHRLLSVYHTRAADKMYIITEADRSVTTLLLPDEY